MLTPGTMIANYVVHSTISTDGGMGDVYLVYNPIGYFALKIAKTFESEYHHRFEREIRILKGLKGIDKIVQIIDSGSFNGQPYYVMPYYKNGSLDNAVSKLKTDYGLAERIFIEMALCVKQLHDNNKYHRDIKPTNFLIADNNDIHLADFGLSIDMSQKSSFTATNDYLGTYLYSPPEYLKGEMHIATPQADIHMLGKSFYYLITGDKPVVIDKDKIPAGLCGHRSENVGFRPV